MVCLVGRTKTHRVTQRDEMNQIDGPLRVAWRPA